MHTDMTKPGRTGAQDTFGAGTGRFGEKTKSDSRTAMEASLLFALPLAITLGIGGARAQTTVKMGILSDMSGLYRMFWLEHRSTVV
jgi:hypothetical protein